MIKVWQAETLGEISKALKFRHDLFCEGRAGEGLEICKAERPDGPHDRFDYHSLFFCASLDGTLIVMTRIVIGPDLPSAAIIRRLGLGLRSSLPGREQMKTWFEPSRLGLLKEYQGTSAGREAVLRVLGRFTDVMARHGRFTCLDTKRPKVAAMLYRWLPYQYGRPCRYAPDDTRGPQTNDPIFPGITSAQEAVAATMWFYPYAYPLMFPIAPTWFNPSLIRSREVMEQVIAKNKKRLRADLRAWQAGESFPVFSGK